MVQAVPPPPSAFQDQVEPRNPLGGFVFSGSDEALAKLKTAGDAAGVKLIAYSLPGSSASALAISANDAFGRFDAVMALWNMAAKGAFGQITGGLLSESPPCR